jgi:hypothetical protein
VKEISALQPPRLVRLAVREHAADLIAGFHALLAVLGDGDPVGGGDERGGERYRTLAARIARS